MHALRLLLLLVTSFLLTIRLAAQTNAPAATLAEQLERTRRLLETQFATNRPPNFEQLVQERAESAFYLPRFTTAVQTGDTNALRQLFRDHPALMDARNLDGPSVQGKVPLMVAAERGDLATVDFLLRRKASVDAVPPSYGSPFSGRPFPRGGPGDYAPPRNTPLHAAARGGHAAVVARLLEGGALVETRDGYSGQTALAGCVQRVSGQSAYQSPAVQPGSEAYQRQLEVIRVLLKHGAQVVSSGYGGFNDPLELAASRGNEVLFDSLLTNSVHVDIAVTNRFGPRETLLHAAVRMGRTNALATLLARRPRPDLTRTNVAGLTPLQLTAGSLLDPGNTGSAPFFSAVQNSPFQARDLHRRVCAELLLQAGAELDIFTAAGSGRAEDVRQWLARSDDAGAKVGARGRTPLHWAVLAYSTNTTAILLAAKAPVNVADSRGATVLHFATSQGDVPLMTRLLAAGADVHLADGQGSTALHHAAGLASAEPLQLLLLAGAKPDARDKRGKTALDLAVAANQTNNVRPLMEAVPSGSEQAKAMLVEVFLTAVGKGDLSQVTNWLAQGVEVNVRDAQGRTAIRLAADAGRMDLLAALQRAGADVNLADTNGVTPLMSRVSVHRAPIDERLLSPSARAGMKRELTLPERFRSPMLAPPSEPLFWLLANGGDLARTNRQGKTALFYLPAVGVDAHYSGAADQVRQSTGLARYLVQRGAKPNARDAEGKTPLHHALLEGDVTRAFALLEAGADLEVADRLGRTAIHQAIMGVGFPREIGRPDVTQHAPSAKEKNLGPILAFVIANGADVRKVDQQGRTPLHTLLAERPAESVYFAPLLLTNKHGAALVRTADKSNSLPAHLAFARLAGAASVEPTRLAIQLARPVVASARAGAQGLNLLHLAAASPHLWLPVGRQSYGPTPSGFPPGGLPADLAKEWRELLVRLAANQAQVQQADAVGDTPLHEAARHNHSELARLLLAHGADPKARNRKGDTPLDVANANSSPARPSSVTPLLTGAGTGQGVAPAALTSPPALKPAPKAQALPPGATTNFWAAIETGDTLSVDAHLRENPALATASNQTTVPLRAAAVAGQLAVADKLRTAGASDLAAAVMLGWTNTVESVLGYQPERAGEVVGGFTLLHWAVRRGQPASARLLLARLTPPFAPDRFGLSARYHARTNAEPGMLETLERAGDQFTLFDAIALRDTGLATQVIARSPTVVSQLNQATDTALFAATVAKDLALVKLLLTAKADPNQRSHVTPLTSRRGGETNIVYVPGNLPLHWAAWTNAVEIGQLLLEHGAEVDAATRVGASALQYAAAQGHRAFADLLVRHRAKLHFQATPPLDQFGYPAGPSVVNGCTALHYAVKHGQVEMVRWLLDQGADTEVLDVWGQSPRDVAVGTPFAPGRGFGLAEPGQNSRLLIGSPIRMLPPVEESTATAIRELLREHRRKVAEGL